ncbi:hypothetical protein GC175_00680 [bacterium]|nr:hypothetical protein [bacterium]
MQDIQEIRQSVIERLEQLPAATLVEVLHYVDYLVERTEQTSPQFYTTEHVQNLPATNAFVELAGSWSFEPGELEEILDYIEQSKLAELEEKDVLLD